jgi:nicotinamide riboside kinase
MLVINFLGEPSAGKSTTSAGLFFLMKHEGINVELVTEFAKDLTWAEDKLKLKDQLLILGDQNHRLMRLKDKVEYVITDSPLLLSIVYAEIYKTAPWQPFYSLVYEVFNSYNNINFLIKRTKPYRTAGRSQDKSQAEIISDKVKNVIARYNIPIIKEDGDIDAPKRILNRLIPF